MDIKGRLRSYLDKRLLELQKVRFDGVKVVGYPVGNHVPKELVEACGALLLSLISGAGDKAFVLAWFKEVARLRRESKEAINK